MTPQEKAKELVEKFDLPNGRKQCAIICVDEVIKSMEMKSLINDDFWFNVKKEIERQDVE